MLQKYSYLILYLVYAAVAASQPVKKTSNGVELAASIAGPDTIDEGILVRLEIRNNNNKDIKIPSRYGVTVNKRRGNISFELIYFSNDSTELAVPIRVNECFFQTSSGEMNLAANQTHRFYTTLRSSYFTRKGKYKIRFFSQPSYNYSELPDISTEWVAIDRLNQTN